METRKIIVNSNCYHGYSLKEAAEGIAQAGFHHIELTATKGWTEHVFPTMRICLRNGNCFGTTALPCRR